MAWAHRKALGGQSPSKGPGGPDASVRPGYAGSVGTFQDRIDRGLITSLEELKSFYKTTLKQFHPDLQGASAPRVDFDRLKKEYDEAFRYLVAMKDRAEAPLVPGNPLPLATKNAFFDEFRELVARGFPVNIQAATKNRAYAASVRKVSRYLEDRFADADFFPRANREARALKRHQPKVHWYILQIFWNLGDWHLTGYDSYRRVFLRHLAFIRETLEEEGYHTVLRFLDYLTG